ncbi:hypothetical protein Bca52824_016978 [Brassica carinata]|uniref:Zinc finger GRF-type domain-containing protein n=1 Tax=Brassica carinata TaxID=52824 RepID=A0A8X7VM79_BRACI|nr:hypothetical protein Bca52824_016978 [Brassica carinata]
MVYAVNDSNYGILERCPCGSQIMVEISTKEADIGKKYFVCRDFKNDGLHIKKEWNEAIEDETRRLKEKVVDNEGRLRSLGALEYQVDRIDKASQSNDANIAHLDYQIDEIDKAMKENADEIAQLGYQFDRMDRASKKNADEIAHVKDIIKKL